MLQYMTILDNTLQYTCILKLYTPQVFAPCSMAVVVLGEHASMHAMHAELAAGGLPEGVKRLSRWLVAHCDLGAAGNEAAAKVLNEQLDVQRPEDLYAVDDAMWGDVAEEIALEHLALIKNAVSEVLANEKAAADEAATATRDALRARMAATVAAKEEAKVKAKEARAKAVKAANTATAATVAPVAKADTAAKGATGAKSYF